jgi:hypothetical protein
MPDEPQTAGDEQAAYGEAERELREVATEMGLELEKSPSTDPDMLDFGLYRIRNPKRNYIVAGHFPYGYSLTLEQVDVILDELQCQREEKELNRQWRLAHPGKNPGTTLRG